MSEPENSPLPALKSRGDTEGPMDRKCIMIIAGEASGDLHGANLVNAMRAKNQDLFFCGMGGRHLREAGVKICIDASELSVVGITEAFSKIPKLFRSSGAIKSLLKHLFPDLLILIDFPDFNLHIAGTAKKLGIPVLYYISPQIWAWRKRRLNKIKQRVDHMAVILPFEESFYRHHGIPATFVGHPLLDRHVGKVKDRAENTGTSEPRRIGLLPGSRDREVARHLPLMMAAAERLSSRYDGMRFLVSLAPSVARKQVEDILSRYSKTGCAELVTDRVEKIFERCEIVVAASGTVTLEAALYGIPMVIIYKVSPLSYWLGRALIRVKYIGLVNLIADREIVPELIQGEASVQNIADAVSGMLCGDSDTQAIKKELSGIRDSLGGTGASGRVSEIALRMLYGNPTI